MEENDQKKKKGEKTKRKLFEAAARLFERYRFDNVTVDSIVEEAGVAKGTFYLYFDSKDELIAEFLSDYVESVDRDYQAHLDSLPPGTKASDIMLSLIAKIAEMLTQTIGLHRMQMMYKTQLTGAVNTDAVKGYNRRLYLIFAEVLENGINRGEFYASLPVEQIARHFVLAIRGLCFEWCIRYPDFDLKEQALSHFELLLKSIETE